MPIYACLLCVLSMTYSRTCVYVHVCVCIYMCICVMCIKQVKRHPLEEKQIAIVVREVLLGLKYLKSFGKIHRDIKGTHTITFYVLMYVMRFDI